MFKSKDKKPSEMNFDENLKVSIFFYCFVKPDTNTDTFHRFIALQKMIDFQLLLNLLINIYNKVAVCFKISLFKNQEYLKSQFL